MELIDFVLNITGLIFWLSYRAASLDASVQLTGVSLAGALKRTRPQPLKRLPFVIGLAGLLLLRAWFYWQIGPALPWVPHLQLGAISIFFRTDLFGRMMLFSLLSFAVTLVIFYVWLLFFSLVNGRRAESEPMQRIVQLHLGWVDRWPWWLKLLLPALLAAVVWLGLDPVLVQFSLIQPAISHAHRIEEAAVIALGTYLTWKYLIAGLLVLWLFSAYVYLGNNAFWTFISITGHNTLRPLRWAPFRIGKLDLAPLAGIFLVFLTSEMAERGLTALYKKLPL